MVEAAADTEVSPLADHGDPPVPDAATIVRLLADGDRRRVLAALVLGSSTADDVRRATGLPLRTILTALARFIDNELVIRSGDGHHLVLGEAFQRAAIAAAPARPAPDPTGDAPEDDARVLQRYFRGGRLVQIPVQRTKKLVVLDRLAQDFEVGVRYPERQVNALLRRYHDDVAALRRYLVDEGFLAREAGEYWRMGGSVRLSQV
jgi:hypothetical protein